MPEPYLPHLVNELQVHGVTDYFLDDTGKHYKLRFVWHDKPLMHVFPRTPSDTKGLQNCLSDLRKQMNVKKQIRKSAHAHRRKRTKAAIVAPHERSPSDQTRSACSLPGAKPKRRGAYARE